MIADSPSSAFRKETISVRVTSDAPAEKLAEVERLALAGCPGISTLRAPVPVESELKVTRASADKAASSNPSGPHSGRAAIAASTAIHNRGRWAGGLQQISCFTP